MCINHHHRSANSFIAKLRCCPIKNERNDEGVDDDDEGSGEKEKKKKKKTIKN